MELLGDHQRNAREEKFTANADEIAVRGRKHGEINGHISFWKYGTGPLQSTAPILHVPKKGRLLSELCVSTKLLTSRLFSREAGRQAV